MYFFNKRTNELPDTKHIKVKALKNIET